MHRRAEERAGPTEVRAADRRRPAIRRLAASLVAVWAVAAAAPPALAEEPTSINRPPALEKFGWWNRAQQLPPGSGEVPPPPGAPERGIYVAQDVAAAAPESPRPDPAPAPPPGAPPTPPPLGVPTPPAAPAPASTTSASDPEPEPSAPARPEATAIGALRYSLPAGARALLTLQVEKGAVGAGNSVLACPVKSSWAPVTNGRWEAKPTFSCASSAKGRAQGKEALVFDLPPALQSDPGVLDLVLVPRGSAPFEIALRAPTDASLVVTLAADGRPGAKEAFAPGVLDDAAAPVRGPARVFRDTRITLSPAAAAVLIDDTAPTVLESIDPSQLPVEAEEPRVLGVVRELRASRGGPALIAGGVALLLLGSGLLWLVRAAGRRPAPAS